jgi:Flp pilus assembly protein TadG
MMSSEALGMKRKGMNLRANESGSVAVIVAIALPVFLAFAALAIDLSHLYVARNELQNAADAGALAGARFLYNDSGTSLNETANQTAYDAAVANNSEKLPVEVQWESGNEGDVQRGHWSFATRTFTPNASLAPVDLWNVSTEELDANANFINAVRVKTRREANPVTLFFARLFGKETTTLTAEAVAYIGFAGTLEPWEVDEPIAICEESILVDNEYQCNIGRMINSGQNISSNETGGWTSFSQDDPCTGGTNATEVRSLVCGSGNPQQIVFGKDIATNGGDIQSAFNKLIQCWNSNTGKTKLWELTLPVVSCPGNNITTCQEVRGAVTLNVVWITDAGEDPSYSNAPTQMQDWSSDSPDGQARWSSFVAHFKLQNVDGSPAPYAKKSIYFLPSCTPHDPKGVSGGENFGILAKIPVLVR